MASSEIFAIIKLFKWMYVRREEMAVRLDNGGAIAIKGFNYQKASLILVIIKNYLRDGFKVIPEAADDFQVHVDGQNIFIQVKGEKSITLTNLINKEIIEKNLVPGQDDDIRKIFVWDIGRSFLSNLEEKRDGHIISPLLKYSKSDEEKIVENLNLDLNQKRRLDNQFIYQTPFSNDLTEAIRCLFGEMVIQKLHIDDKTGRALLAELSLIIDQKSETLFDGNNHQEKEINGNYLKEIFTQVQKIEMFNEVLDKLPYNSFKKEKVKQERAKVPIAYYSIKKSVKKKCKDLDLDIENTPEKELVNKIIEIIDGTSSITAENLKIAIAIECLCELWENS